MAEKHLTPQDLAERENVPLKTVYDWNSKGTGPRYLKVGRGARYRLADVIAWENTRYADQGGTAA
ncbi:helix-turn-helix transcriptional regulator [Actinomadura xylanilytica]|uniref:helix-turn-helix transcriptional regulator n=1 Tax=Actinomadura xylanilytica TaxID=887459 RepID=UPI00255B1211|nr:helix-turn-helix domain-containing protein [Actinomadura xylanilytica]MDL4772917.1 helix-turn-helix domain-containing protein [Actinomadura xylanilytica]